LRVPAIVAGVACLIGAAAFGTLDARSVQQHNEVVDAQVSYASRQAEHALTREHRRHSPGRIAADLQNEFGIVGARAGGHQRPRLARERQIHDAKSDRFGSGRRVDTDGHARQHLGAAREKIVERTGEFGDHQAAALLHDVVEDTGVSISDIAHMFGDEIVRLVDGVTKISSIKKKSRASAQAEQRAA
jgi:hypothetical protein